jgi:hypothetical protein
VSLQSGGFVMPGRATVHRLAKTLSDSEAT